MNRSGLAHVLVFPLQWVELTDVQNYCYVLLQSLEPSLKSKPNFCAAVLKVRELKMQDVE